MSKEIERDQNKTIGRRRDIISKIKAALGHHSCLPLFNITRQKGRYGYSVIRSQNIKRNTTEWSFERYDVTKLEGVTPTEVIIRSFVFSEDGSDRIHVNKVKGIKPGEDDSFGWHRLSVRQGLEPKSLHPSDYSYVLNELTIALFLTGNRRRYRKINIGRSN